MRGNGINEMGWNGKRVDCRGSRFVEMESMYATNCHLRRLGLATPFIPSNQKEPETCHDAKVQVWMDARTGGCAQCGSSQGLTGSFQLFGFVL